jgi:hypothetical protein
MKPYATIELGPETPARAREILDALPELRVRTGKTSAVVLDASRYPLVLLQGIASYAHATAPLLADLTKPDQIPMVVAERLTGSVRDALEAAGCSYADATGVVHLDVPGLLLHVGTRKRGPATTTRTSGIGAVGVRVVQTLLHATEREWTVTDLARESGASVGEAHKVIQRLEEEELLTTIGAGKARRRRIAQPTDLLEWLARLPAARRLHTRMNAYLYAPDPDALITRLSYHAHESATTWALTGAAAARVMGVTAVTTLPVAMVRVPTKPGLVEAANTLGAEPVETGHNLTLVADVGAVGTHGAAQLGPVVVAPAVRIWLDMLGEPRGEDAAALFREGVLGY